jgi:tetratricopeptide (TPR) repeat protein
MKPTICLNMIVKNEAGVIRRSLGSIKEFIDYWVIVDTGSTDGTQEIIRGYMSDIPGSLYQSSWVDFSYHRNEALRLSHGRGDYVIFIDADEKFLPSPGFSFSFLSQDYYLGTFVFEDGRQFHRVLAIRNSPYFFWVGAVHEMVVHEKKVCQGILVEGVQVAYLSGGCRSLDPFTFERDAKLLTREVERDPLNGRSLFFLALTYERLQKFDLALACFERRSSMRGCAQEVFYSLLSKGIIEMHQGNLGFLQTLWSANRLMPMRPEPIYFIALTFESQGKFQEAYDILDPFIRSFDKSSLGYQIFFNLKIAEIEIPSLFARICELMKSKTKINDNFMFS